MSNQEAFADVLNGSFESDTVTDHSGQWEIFNTITGWTTTNACGDQGELHTTALGFSNTHDGTNYMEMDSNCATTISQEVSTIYGATYELTFLTMQRSGTTDASNGIEVKVDGVSVFTDTVDSTTFETFTSSTFVADGSSTIEFIDTGVSDGLGTFLDDIELVQVEEPIERPRIISLGLEFQPDLGVELTITPNNNCVDDTTSEPAEYLILKRTALEGEEFEDPLAIIDRIDAVDGDCEDTTYLDTDVAMGETVRYRVVAFNSDFTGDPEDSENNDGINRSDRSPPRTIEITSQVVEVHCDVEYEFGVDYDFEDGERYGYGECTYYFADGSEEEHEVHLGGEFGLEFGDGLDLSGTFHIEDYYGNAIWLDEEGTVEIPCDIDGENGGIPYCVETELTAFDGSGIFGFINEEDEDGGTRTAEGYVYFDEYLEGYAHGTIWLFFTNQTPEPELEPKSGGSSCHVAPTFGTPFNCTDRNFVDDGVTIHGTSYDPTNELHIKNPRIDAVVGTPYSIELKPYESYGQFNIKWVAVSLGLIEGDFVFGNGEAVIYLHQDYDGTFTIEENDENDIVNVIDFKKSRDAVCAVEDNDALCPVYRLDYSYNQAPLGDMVGVQVVNHDRSTENRFFNDGIDVTGDSLNPSPVIQVLADEKFVAHHYLTYSDPSFKDRTVAVDENGKTWYQADNGVWFTEAIMPDRSCKSTSTGFASHCPEFAMMMQGQELIAQNTIDTMYPNLNKYESFAEIDRVFAYEYPTTSQRELTLQTLDWYNTN
jgi:hypothetical protein